MAKYQYVTRELTVGETIDFQGWTRSEDMEAAMLLCLARRVDSEEATEEEYLTLPNSIMAIELQAVIDGIIAGQKADTLLKGINFDFTTLQESPDQP